MNGSLVDSGSTGGKDLTGNTGVIKIGSIVYGDVSRPKPMTVPWTQYAQTLTHKPVKGMLTGPITILQWSFVRNDQPRSKTAKQIALAIRDEVLDLEKAGVPIIGSGGTHRRPLGVHPDLSR